MRDHSDRPHRRIETNAPGYERRDADPRWIFGIVVFLLIAGLLMHFVLAGAMQRLRKKPAPTDPWSVAGTKSLPTAMSSGPRLQIAPHQDLQTFREREDVELNHYGWVNRSAGVVRIPIDRAMDLILQQGLPVTTNVDVNQWRYR